MIDPSTRSNQRTPSQVVTRQKTRETEIHRLTGCERQRDSPSANLLRRSADIQEKPTEVESEPVAMVQFGYIACHGTSACTVSHFKGSTTGPHGSSSESANSRNMQSLCETPKVSGGVRRLVLKTYNEAATGQDKKTNSKW